MSRSRKTSMSPSGSLTSSRAGAGLCAWCTSPLRPSRVHTEILTEFYRGVRCDHCTMWSSTNGEKIVFCASPHCSLPILAPHNYSRVNCYCGWGRSVPIPTWGQCPTCHQNMLSEVGSEEGLCPHCSASFRPIGGVPKMSMAMRQWRLFGYFGCASILFGAALSAVLILAFGVISIHFIYFAGLGIFLIGLALVYRSRANQAIARFESLPALIALDEPPLLASSRGRTRNDSGQVSSKQQAHLANDAAGDVSEARAQRTSSSKNARRKRKKATKRADTNV